MLPNVYKSGVKLITFKIWTIQNLVHHLNPKQVWYSDSHCTCWVELITVEMAGARTTLGWLDWSSLKLKYPDRILSMSWGRTDGKVHSVWVHCEHNLLAGTGRQRLLLPFIELSAISPELENRKGSITNTVLRDHSVWSPRTIRRCWNAGALYILSDCNTLL